MKATTQDEGGVGVVVDGDSAEGWDGVEDSVDHASLAHLREGPFERDLKFRREFPDRTESESCKKTKNWKENFVPRDLGIS